MTGQIRSLSTMTRWEMIRILYGRGIIRRLVLPSLLFIVWIVLNAATLPWILQFDLPILSMVIFFPVVALAGYIADSFAGERERSTLELLLLSPAPDWVIVSSKALALLIVALGLLGLNLLALGIVVSLLPGATAPRPLWYALALFYGLIVFITVIHLGLIVSWSSPNVQTAQQVMVSSVTILAIGGVGVQMFLRRPAIPLEFTAPGVALGAVIVAVGSVAVTLYRFRRGRLLLQ